MFASLPPYILYIASVIVSAVVSMYAVKKLIFIARKRKIYDIPDNIRKIHGAEIPSLGGIGVFIGYMATIPLFIASGAGPGWNYIIVSTVILFFTGIYDDLMNMRPSKKLLAQLIASAVTVYFADIRLVSFYGLFGIEQLPYWVSVGLTTFLCTFFINVYNFIDGIDGLACLLGMLYCAVFGCFFILENQPAEACICFCLLGATAGLLYYNYAPAKIYLGDTGSMLTGFSIFIFALGILGRTVYHNRELAGVSRNSPELMMVVAVLFYPVFDALRVFALRLKNGISPLKADRRHLHYYLLDSGMGHAATAWLLVGVNALTILIAMLAISLHPVLQLLLIAAPSSFVAVIAHRAMRKKMSKQ
jgi:UDP-GlcNAc:undecaprenyl-phosphate GlcNAc-1-phosphate transferase